jgi:hypothetical protein
MSETLNRFMKRQEIHHLHTSAFHPRSNGTIERFNALFISMLTKYGRGDRQKWDTYILQSLFACRIRTHAVTRETPFFLTYGIEPTIPGDEQKLDELARSTQDVRAHELELLGERREAARLRCKQSGENAKRRYDQRATPRLFDVGQWVLMRNETHQKFQSKNRGPYQIYKICPLHTYHRPKRGRKIVTRLDSTYISRGLARLEPSRVQLPSIDSKCTFIGDC